MPAIRGHFRGFGEAHAVSGDGGNGECAKIAFQSLASPNPFLAAGQLAVMKTAGDRDDKPQQTRDLASRLH